MSLNTPYDENNIFAKILRGEAPAHKVYEDEHTFAFMDIMPMAEGHTLVIPREPAVNMFDLSEAAAEAMIRTTRKVAHAVRTTFDPHGVICAQFSGAPAGQTVFHIHFHVIPRWEGIEMNLHARTMQDADILADHASRITGNLG